MRSSKASSGMKTLETEFDELELDAFKDKLQSMQAALHDIDRWLMQGVANGRLSADRKRDIAYYAKRIADTITKL